MEEKITPKDAYDEIFYKSKNILNYGDKLEEIINNKQIINEFKDLFRDINGNWIYKSRVMKHAYEKPFGYPGDYQIIELIYDNRPQSPGIGYCFDKYFLENTYANAVRGRKDKIKEILINFINQSNFATINILNIACGPCREIRELFAENNFNESKTFIFSLLDHDINALLYSNEILRDPPKNVEYKFIRTDIFEFINNPTYNYTILAKKDLIYCIGLLDYLPERVVKQLLLFLYNLLNSGGKLIIAHKDSKTHKPLDPDWFCDWKFYLRNPKELLNIINNCGINDFNLKSTWESIENKIFLFIIEKIS